MDWNISEEYKKVKRNNKITPEQKKLRKDNFNKKVKQQKKEIDQILKNIELKFGQKILKSDSRVKVVHDERKRVYKILFKKGYSVASIARYFKKYHTSVSQALGFYN